MLTHLNAIRCPSAVPYHRTAKKPSASQKGAIVAVRFLFHGSVDHEPPHPQTPEGVPTGQSSPCGPPPKVCMRVPLMINRLSRHKRSLQMSRSSKKQKIIFVPIITLPATYFYSAEVVCGFPNPDFIRRFGQLRHTYPGHFSILETFFLAFILPQKPAEGRF